MKIVAIAPYYSEAVRRALRLSGEFSPGGLNKIKPLVTLLSLDHRVTLLSTGYSRAANFRWVPRRTEYLPLGQRRVPVIYPAYPALRFFSFFGIACSLLVECLRERPELIIFYNFRPETFGPAWLARIIRGARIVCQFEDGLHVLFGRFSPRRLAFRMTYELGKRFCDGLTLVNSGLRGEFKGKVSAVIPFILPDDSAVPAGPVIHRLKERTPLRVSYTGSLDRERGADIFVEAARRLEPDSRLQFFIAGRGPLLSWVREQTRELRNLTYLGLLNTEEVGEHQRSTDILVNPQRLSHPFSRFSFPSKVMSYILLNKPIVSTAFADIADLPAPGLCFYHDDDPAGLARVIGGLASDDVEVDYRALYEKFSAQRMRQALNDVIRGVQP